MRLLDTIKPIVPPAARRALRKSSRLLDLWAPIQAEKLRVRRRHAFAMRYYEPQLDRIATWARSKSEESNFLYDIDARSRTDLAHLLTVLFGGAPEIYRQYFAEIDRDETFYNHVRHELRRHLPDASSIHVGRRLGWYGVARRCKPRLIVETGVDFGLGSCVLSAALIRNAKEGAPGRYLGTELRSEAGQIYLAPYNSVGRIAYGDSIETLRTIDQPIDLFINDSDHSAEYEAQEYETIADLLSESAVILGDNSHTNSVLADFSERYDRRFAFFKEVPKDHWYPGAGIGISVR